MIFIETRVLCSQTTKVRGAMKYAMQVFVEGVQNITLLNSYNVACALNYSN